VKRIHEWELTSLSFPLADFSTLKMEAIRSSETSVNARSTQLHIPEDDILQLHFISEVAREQQGGPKKN
jgi:hypothetical protein